MKRPRKNRAIDRATYTELTQLPNIGPACAADLRLLGIRSPKELLGRDPMPCTSRFVGLLASATTLA